MHVEREAVEVESWNGIEAKRAMADRRWLQAQMHEVQLRLRQNRVLAGGTRDAP